MNSFIKETTLGYHILLTDTTENMTLYYTAQSCAAWQTSLKGAMLCCRKSNHSFTQHIWQCWVSCL